MLRHSWVIAILGLAACAISDPPVPSTSIPSAGAAGIFWRCVPEPPATACGGRIAGSTAIWHGADAGQTTYAGAVDDSWTIQGVGDFDGNGVSDILWRSLRGENVLWADGIAPDYSIAPVEAAWLVAGIGDFNGNGKSDILWRSTFGSLAIWTDGIAPGYWPATLDNTWQVAGIGDFTGDGQSDILWRSVNGDNVIWPAATSQGIQLQPLVDGWQVAGIGDFDHNGRSDILWRCHPAGPCGNAIGGSTTIWTFENGSHASTTWPGALDGNWQIQGVGDFNGDGTSDILWRCVPLGSATSCGDTSAGAIAIWQLSNANYDQMSWRGALDLSWQIQRVGKFD